MVVHLYVPLHYTKTTKEMKAIKENIWGFKVGDKVTFTNNTGSLREVTIGRVEEKSWYTPSGGRNSWNTIAQYLKYPDAKIYRS